MANFDDAIVGALRGNTALKNMMGAKEKGIGHGRVLPGTKAPYLLVLDVADDINYVFGNKEAYSEQWYDIVVYTVDTASRTAQDTANDILARVAGILHNKAIAVAGRTNVEFQMGPRLKTGWDTINDQEQYFRDGRRYLVWSAPSP